MVQIHGRWRTRKRPQHDQLMLVVEADGRRHRFPAIPQPRRLRLARPRTWSGSFALPAWLGPRLKGHTTLMLGGLSVPLPGVQSGHEELRSELDELRELIAREAAGRDRLADEIARLRSGLERLSAELSAASEQAAAGEPELEEAEALLAQARALRASLSGDRHGTARVLARAESPDVG
jgi:hypothetical protein